MIRDGELTWRGPVDEAHIQNLQRSAAALGFVAMSLQHFSSLLIRIGVEGGVLEPEVLTALRDQTIRSLKNSQAVGVSMEMEADTIGQALGILESMVDQAISDAQA